MQRATSILRSFSEVGTDARIRKVVKWSYDALDPRRQRLFLDIAAFFLGRQRQEPEWVHDACYPHESGGGHLDALISLSLVHCDPEGRLGMHDTLVDMAFHLMSLPECPATYRVYLEGWQHNITLQINQVSHLM